MKKISILSLLLLGVVSLLTACGTSDSSSSTYGSQTNETSSTSSSQSTSSSTTEYKKVSFVDDVTCPSDDQISEMSLSGVFLDVAIGSHLVVGKEYSLNFSSLPSSFNGTPVFVIQDESIMSIEYVSGTSYKLKGLMEGGTILTIMDQDGIMYYRNAFNFRNKYSLAEVMNYAINSVNYYASCYSSTKYNNYKIMFESYDDSSDVFTSTAILEATEDGVYYGVMTLNMTYEGEIDNSDYNEYSFTLTYVADDQSNPLQPSYLRISTVCDIVHLGSNNGLYDFFMPVSID